jgi:hypothetical protein
MAAPQAQVAKAEGGSMSVRLMAEVWQLPMVPAEKLVALALADAANDDGLCWPSIATIARKSGLSERTVQRTIRGFERSWVKRDEVIGKGCKYVLNPRHYVTPDTTSPVTPATDTGDTMSPKPSRTIRPQKTSSSSVSRATRLPDDWLPAPLTGQSAEAVVPWQAGRLERELSKFRDHWAASSGANARKHDWQAAWRNWVLKADEQGDRNGNGRLAQRTKGTPGVGRTTEAANRLIARLSAETPSRFS